jgi:hypothetical protein
MLAQRRTSVLLAEETLTYGKSVWHSNISRRPPRLVDDPNIDARRKLILVLRNRRRPALMLLEIAICGHDGCCEPGSTCYQDVKAERRFAHPRLSYTKRMRAEGN